MGYQLIIYDFDGTLVDSFPFFISIINRLAQRHKFKTIGPDEIDLLRGQEVKRILKHLELPRWKIPAVLLDFQRLMSDKVDQIPLFPGVDKMLSTLFEREKTLAIITSNSFSNVIRILTPKNAAFIHHYQCGVSLFGKPFKIKKILRETGIPSSKAIYIGDEVRDVEAAQANGVAFGAVSWGYTKLTTLLQHMPNEVFSHPNEVISRLA